MNLPIVITFNVGSATMKIAAYDAQQDRHIDPLKRQALFDVNINLKTKKMLWHGDTPNVLQDWQPTDSLTDTAISLFHKIHQNFSHRQIVCVHRVVHGGKQYHQPVLITPEVFDNLTKLSPICPLHQPPALSVVTALQQIDPQMPQIAAFDTAFHAGRPKLWAEYALPKSLRDEGIRCYGFHGLSYQAIMRRIDAFAPSLLNKRLIVAHLGSGCSITAIHHAQSQDSTFGFSGLDGVPMGTRSGHLDAGVILYMVEQGWTLEQMNQCLYKQSGLLGLSEISNDVQELLESDDEKAKFAIDYFVAHVAKEIASLMVSMQGADALIFTAGIGENSAVIRQKVVDYLAFLGFSIDSHCNHDGKPNIAITAIHDVNSQKQIFVIPTDEQLELYLAFNQVFLT